jgi:hypothetical protein
MELLVVPSSPEGHDRNEKPREKKQVKRGSESARLRVPARNPIVIAV